MSKYVLSRHNVPNSTLQNLSQEVNSSLASRKIPRILCNPVVDYPIYNSLSFVPMQSNPGIPIQFLQNPF